MWFLGLVLGAIVGGMVGDGAGAFAGAAVGAIAGWALSQKARAPQAERVEAIEKALRGLEARIGALERAEARVAAAGEDIAKAGVPAAPAEGAELPTAPARVDALADAFAGAAHAASAEIREEAKHSSGVSRATEIKAWALGPQMAGLVIGVLVGYSGGYTGMVVGALLGWLVGLAIVSQNRRAARDAAAVLAARQAQQATPAPAAPRAPAEPLATGGAALTAEAAAAQAAADSAEPAVDALGIAGAGDAVVPKPAFLQRLIGGNIVAKIGVLILFVGVGFLLKYAYDQGRLPVQLRLAAVAGFGLAMLYGGWRLLGRRRLYALILQGGGIGLLYLDVFFALRLYGLIDAAAGFAVFMALGVAATLLALRQDAKVLAVLGLTGAFLAPILASTGSGNHVLLFSYYTLLNSFVLAISWFKAWRDLNLVGFVFTFAVGLLWGSEHYRPALFGTVEPFLLVFVAMYLVIPMLFAQRQPPELKGLVDGTLVFGTPICAAFMQAGLVKGMPYGLALSAGIAGAVYAVLAMMTLRRAGMRLLGETYIALGVVFITLAIFFAFDAYPTFALWTLEGAAVVWVGLRQRRLTARVFGLALQLAGTAYFLTEYPKYALTNPWWNGFVIGCVIIAAAGLIIAWLFHRYRDARSNVEPTDAIMLGWGLSWWAIAGLHALHHAYPWQGFAPAVLGFTAASAIAVELIGSRLQWTALRRAAAVLAPGMGLVFLLQAARGAHPFEQYGWLAWPAAVGVLYRVLRRHERDGIAVQPQAQHLAALWLGLAVLTWEAAWQVDTLGFGKPWLTAVCGLIPALAVGWISSSRGIKPGWLFGRHDTSIHRERALVPIVVYLTLWGLYANLSAPGEMRPLSYVPVLNPLDIANLVMLAAVWQGSRTLGMAGVRTNGVAVRVFAALAFLWVNAVMLRTMLYWAHVDYAWEAWTQSVVVQAGFSLLWTATAFVLMFYATRVRHRALWMVGAALLAVVVLKLFLNDLGGTGTVARIVSFIGVGAGLLLIGYAAPVPPGDTERQAD